MNIKEFKGKVALVTGASRGIGKAIAIELAKNGAAVAINYNSDLVAAKITLKLIKKLEVNSEIFKADVSKEKDVKALINNVEKKLGPIDLLVTNAGVLHLSKDFLELDYKIWKKTMATNVDGTLLPIKEVLPGMIKRKFGRIVCISSIAGLGMRPNMITYGTSKAAVIALVRNLSSAVAPYIRINSVAPGLIETDMAKLFDKKTKKNIIKDTPLKRLGTPQDIANTVFYLLSEQSKFTTGQTLVTDGGKIALP
jgi:3-oxoacyl-[acyl-carrier protein] reductase